MKKKYYKPVTEIVAVSHSHALLVVSEKAEDPWAEGKGNLLDDSDDDGSSQRGSYNIWKGWDE